MDAIIRAREAGYAPRTRAIIVYPMNALANSQVKEINKFIDQSGLSENLRPVVRRYTGQENQEERQRVADNPPDILLTNFMMAELLLTRQDPVDSQVMANASGLEFIVLDELHTYRGRQGADVAILVRRLRDRCTPNKVPICIGTSATMSSEGSGASRALEVSKVVSRLFGTAIGPDGVIDESLRREFVQLRLRKRVLEAIEVVLEEEVNQALGCCSYERAEDRRGYRNGAETRRVTTSVGTRELRVPRARVRDEETGETTEFRSELLPRYARRTREVDEALLGTYLSGANSRRIRKALKPLLGEEHLSKSCLGAQLSISVHNCPVLADTRFPMSIFKRTQRKYVKKAYRVRNWREYEAGLRNRGSLTVWISLTAGKLVNWDAPRPRRRKPGRQRKYSNHAIETAVTLGMVFHLSSRQSEGLLRSLFALMKLDNDVPDHTTISRRKPKLGKVPFYPVKQKTPLHILFDSSGLAVHAGQLRRAQKSRDYRKLHLCVDEQSGEVVAGELTSKRARDSSRVTSLVGQIDSPISSARADTAYDAGGVYEAIENHSAHRSPRVLIPPRKGALLASGPASSRQRNRNIAAQARLGKRKWHTESGYSKRSKVETTFHRYKAIVGSAMRARGLAAQRGEARIGCKILNHDGARDA